MLNDLKIYKKKNKKIEFEVSQYLLWVCTLEMATELISNKTENANQ